MATTDERAQVDAEVKALQARITELERQMADHEGALRSARWELKPLRRQLHEGRVRLSAIDKGIGSIDA